MNVSNSLSKSYTPLYMTVRDLEALTLMAACLQDALIPLSGIDYDEENACFRLVANRFCWECDPEICENAPVYARVIAGLTFQNVSEVSQRGLDLSHKNELISLLTIQGIPEENAICLMFSGGSEIKIKVDQVLCHLKDIDEPYSTPNKPEHAGI